MVSFAFLIFYSSPTTGCISEILNGPIGENFFRDTVVLISISSAMYLSVWLFIRYGKNGKWFAQYFMSNPQLLQWPNKRMAASSNHW
jgi:hypothetical protein